jgi:hypothetical protein
MSTNMQNGIFGNGISQWRKLASTCKVLKVATLPEAAACVTQCDQNLQMWVQLPRIELLINK